MNYMALIPARGGSKGIPGKNIKPFCGIPLIQWSINQARAVGLPVYVSTDSEDVARVSEGAKIIHRPSNLSCDDSPMICVIQHAFSTIGDVDWIVLLQPTNPLRYSTDIPSVMKIVSDNKDVKNLIVCTAYKSSYYTAEGHYPTSGHRRQDDDRLFVTGLVYCFSFQSLYCWPAEVNVKFHVVPKWQSHELDEPDDWPIAEYLFKEKICLTQG
jgi:CMP-N,N'-diacetyllegionaminic acid synthase